MSQFPKFSLEGDRYDQVFNEFANLFQRGLNFYVIIHLLKYCCLRLNNNLGSILAIERQTTILSKMRVAT